MRILKENYQKLILKYNKNLNSTSESKLLDELTKHENQNRHLPKNGRRYSTYMKDMMLYFFINMGPLSYLDMKANFPNSIPSLRSTQDRLKTCEGMKEGVFEFDRIAEKMEQRNEPKFVVVAEDDTKIVERLRYDSKHDELVGLMLPIDENGIPIPGSFKFRSLSEVLKFYKEHKMSSYAKLMTVRSLHIDTPTYYLCFYGTRGSDNHQHVKARWEFVQREFKLRGIEVLCKLILSSKVFDH